MRLAWEGASAHLIDQAQKRPRRTLKQSQSEIIPRRNVRISALFMLRLPGTGEGLMSCVGSSTGGHKVPYSPKM